MKKILMLLTLLFVVIGMSSNLVLAKNFNNDFNNNHGCKEDQKWNSDKKICENKENHDNKDKCDKDQKWNEDKKKCEDKENHDNEDKCEDGQSWNEDKQKCEDKKNHDNDDDDKDNEVPEFGVMASAAALIGAIGIFVYRRKN